MHKYVVLVHVHMHSEIEYMWMFLIMCYNILGQVRSALPATGTS